MTFFSKFKESLIDLNDQIKLIILNVFNLKKEDLKVFFLDKVLNISQTMLRNFSWNLKVFLWTNFICKNGDKIY